MTVHRRDEGAVAIVTLDRPDRRNAIDRAHAQALAAEFRAIEADDSIRVSVLTGAGGHFCAGADLKAIASGEGNRVAPDGDGPLGPTRMQLAKTVIAAVEGFAVAGGLELACWCDLRVAGEGARFGVLCRRWGVPLIDGGTIRLPRLIGQSHAMDLILTGREIDLDEAWRMGLVNRRVAQGQALDAAIELAAHLAEVPQRAMLGDRASALGQWSLPLDQALQVELGHGMAALSTEVLAGARAFAGADPDAD